MRSSQNDGSSRQDTGNDVPEKPDRLEDEINLIDYLRVLGKRKWFILLGSIIPTLLVGLIISFLPRHYTKTYMYDVEDQFENRFTNQFAKPATVNISDWNLNQKNFDVLLSRFYSKENLSRITNGLQQAGFGQYAKSISTTIGLNGLESLVKFEVSPSYIDLDEVDQMSLTELKQIKQLEAQLLNVTITGTSLKDISIISSVIRDNLENTIPVYLIAEQLGVGMRELRAKIADIENETYALGLVLKKSGAVLEKLKTVETQTSSKATSGIVLQFDVGNKSQYLPLEYQIQMAESEIIQLEETVEDNKRRYKYYRDLLSLNQKLLTQIESRSSSACTIQQFRSFLVELTKDTEQKELKDYLNSYVKGVENRIAVSAPVTEEPRIYAVHRGITKKTAAVFVVLLMLATFTAFLLEGFGKSRARAS